MHLIFSRCVAVLLLSITAAVHSNERHVRHNLAGYFPKAPKQLVIISSEECRGMAWALKDSVSGTAVLSGTVGGSLAAASDFSPFQFHYRIDFSAVSKPGTYHFMLDGKKNGSITISAGRYRDAATALVRFLRVMRSGTTQTLDRQPAHFRDSAAYIYYRNGNRATDSWSENKKRTTADMRGGWYDGSTYIKYTLMNAYASYCLLRAFESNPALFGEASAAGSTSPLIEEIQFGLDYLMKTMPSPRDFIIQVGGFDDDQAGVFLPHEDRREGARECYSIFSAPQMAMSAAALALGARILGPLGLADAAGRYKAMAQKLYGIAASPQAKPAWLEQEYDLHKDESSNDNLMLAAAELYLLTKETTYATAVKKYAATVKGESPIGFEQVDLLAHERSAALNPPSRETIDKAIGSFAAYMAQPDNVFGVPFWYSFKSCYGYAVAGSAALLHHGAKRDSAAIGVALRCADFIYGANNWGVSFVPVSSIPHSVRNSSVAVYRLQTRLFPQGAAVAGPCDNETYNQEPNWRYFDPKAQPTYRFNTPKVSFFDHADDYLSMSSYITGVADQLLFVSLLVKEMGE